MTDKELLELAAKAAGIINQGYCESGFLFTGTGESGAFYKWNPLTNDGDALRLAVKLNISVDRSRFRCWAWANEWTFPGVCEELNNNDPYAATRRAIVRAAAEIGKEMK